MMNKNFFLRIMSTALLLVCYSFAFGNTGTDIEKYNVVWTTPSQNASGSMPIGNGELAANVWVEENGDLVFYMSRTDSWNETGELCKLGRIRVSFTPAVFSSSDFNQTLDLYNGCIRLKGNGADLSFWVDSAEPVIRIAGKSPEGVLVSVKAEVWRDKVEKIMPADANSVARSISGFPDTMEFFRYPDEILDFENAVVVRHCNKCSSYDMTLDLQGINLENRAAYDPFLNRCFGFRIDGKNFIKQSSLELASDGELKDIDIRIATESNIYPDHDGWTKKITETTESAPLIGKSAARTSKFWHGFWNRSYIFVETPDMVTGERINRAYVLQRWVQACAGRGKYPIKFNGSLFTVDSKYTDPSVDYNPDYRRWGWRLLVAEYPFYVLSDAQIRRF